jgi:hypothetical protein
MCGWGIKVAVPRRAKDCHTCSSFFKTGGGWCLCQHYPYMLNHTAPVEMLGEIPFSLNWHCSKLAHSMVHDQYLISHANTCWLAGMDLWNSWRTRYHILGVLRPLFGPTRWHPIHGLDPWILSLCLRASSVWHKWNGWWPWQGVRHMTLMPKHQVRLSDPLIFYLWLWRLCHDT